MRGGGGGTKAGNYRLKASSSSVDKGVAIKGINDGSVNAPDLGAYEYGGKDWTAGAEISVPDFPDERSDYFIK